MNKIKELIEESIKLKSEGKSKELSDNLLLLLDELEFGKIDEELVDVIMKNFKDELLNLKHTINENVDTLQSMYNDAVESGKKAFNNMSPEVKERIKLTNPDLYKKMTSET